MLSRYGRLAGLAAVLASARAAAGSVLISPASVNGWSSSAEAQAVPSSHAVTVASSA